MAGEDSSLCVSVPSYEIRKDDAGKEFCENASVSKKSAAEDEEVMKGRQVEIQNNAAPLRRRLHISNVAQG